MRLLWIHFAFDWKVNVTRSFEWQDRLWFEGIMRETMKEHEWNYDINMMLIGDALMELESNSRTEGWSES